MDSMDALVQQVASGQVRIGSTVVDVESKESGTTSGLLIGIAGVSPNRYVLVEFWPSLVHRIPEGNLTSFQHPAHF